MTMLSRGPERWLRCGLLAIFVLALALPASAQATSLMVEHLQSPGSGINQAAHGAAGHMGARYARQIVEHGSTPWGAAFNWDGGTTQFVQDAADHEMRPYLTLSGEGTPTPAEYGQWCGQAASRYDGQAGRPLVLDYGVWNEPNHSPRIAPSLYRELYVSCRAAITAVRADANVYFGELEAGGAGVCTYLAEALTPTLRAPHIIATEGVAIHPYQYTTHPTLPVAGDPCRGIGNLPNWNARLASIHAGHISRYTGGTPPVIISEFGYCAARPPEHPADPYNKFSGLAACPQNAAGAANVLDEGTRAAFVQAAFTWASQNGVPIFDYHGVVGREAGNFKGNERCVGDDGSANPACAGLPTSERGRGYLWNSGLIANPSGAATPSVSALRIATGTVAPSVATSAPTSVDGRTATLNGSVNPNGFKASYRFDYGTDTSYGSSVPVPVGQLAAGSSPVAVSHGLTGLRPLTNYHYRLVATTRAGTSETSSGTFRTTLLDDRPAVVRGFNGVGRSTFVTNQWGSVRVSTKIGAERSAWTTIGAGAVSAPAAVRREDGTVDLFVLWNDDSVRRKTISPLGVESGWDPIGLSGVSAPAATMRRGPDGSVSPVIDVVVRGPDNDLLFTSLDTWTRRQWGPYSLGGTFRSAPAITSYFDGGVHIYARGTDDAIHQKYWDGREWHGWHWLGGVASSSPAVTSWYDGNIEVGVRGTDGAFYHKGWNPTGGVDRRGSWSEWGRQGLQLASAPALSTERPGQLVVTAREGGEIKQHIYDNDAWGGWTSLGDPDAAGEFLSPAAVIENAGGTSASMFVRDGDGVIRTSTTNGFDQTPWRAIGGRVNSAPAAVRRSDGTTDVFALVDGAVQHKTVSSAGVESAWRSAGLSGVSAPAAAMRRGPDGSIGTVIDVVVRGAGNDILLNSFNTTTGTWGGAYSLGGTFRSAPTIMSYFDGGVHVHARGTDDAVHQKFWIPGERQWSPWYWVGGTTYSSPTATSWYTGNIEVGVLSTDSAFYNNGWNPAGGADRRGAWGGWIRTDVHLDSAPTLSSGRPGQLRVFGRQGEYLIRRVYDNDAWGQWIWLGNPSLRLVNP